MPKPLLIVVCGAPASGKTILARRLAEDFELPLIEKDVIKESLADAIATPDRNAARRIGAVSFRVLYDLAFSMLERGTDVMIEANLDRRFAAVELERLAGKSRMVIVQCEAEQGTIERRYRDRHADGGRHVAHFDLDAVPDLVAGLAAGSYDVADLGHPIVTVGTDDGYAPEYEEIVRLIRLP